MGSVTHQRFSSKSIFIRLLSQMRRFSEPEFTALWQCFQSFYSPEHSWHCSISWRALPPTVPTYGSTFPAFKSLAARYRIHVGLLASCLLSPIKPEKYPVKTFMTMNDSKIAVGKYLVSPLAKQQGEGYAASVSIRSGRGSGTHDRVLRFTEIFDSAAAAIHYATEHALCWIHDRSSPVCA